MENRCAILWTAKCKARGSPNDNEKQTKYFIQHRYSIRYIPDCAATVMMDDQVFKVQPGSFFFIPPDVKFRIMFQSKDKNSLFNYYDIIFSPRDPAMLRRLSRVFPPRPSDPSSKTMLDYIIGNWHREDEVIQSNCSSYLTSLLLLLNNDFEKNNSLGSQFILTPDYSRATLSALDYVENNYYSRFTLDEMAKALGYSKNYLCMSFSGDTGISIITYTNFLRIRKSIGNIFYFPQPIHIISDILSFNNPNYFTRTFKAFVGISPRLFSIAVSSMTPEEKADIYAAESLLRYQRCSIDDALASMRHIGQLAAERYERIKAENGAE